MHLSNHLALLMCTFMSVTGVQLDVYYEPLDEASTRFFREQLQPLINSSLGKQVQLSMVPYGRSQCDNSPGGITCKCTHGEQECQLIYLQSCVMHEYRPPVGCLDAIACTQGETNFEQAFKECVAPLKLSKWYHECSTTVRGVYLAWLQGLRTQNVAPKLPYVPYLVLNGKENKEAVQDLRHELCAQLKDQKLAECT